MHSFNPPIFVTYDDAKNGIRDVSGNITNIEPFFKAIEEGRIKNVRVWVSKTAALPDRLHGLARRVGGVYGEDTALLFDAADTLALVFSNTDSETPGTDSKTAG